MQLKGHNPAIIAVHCVSYRLASQAADSIIYIQKFKGHISDFQILATITVLSVLLLLKQ